MHVVGIDSCPGGWITITYDSGDRMLAPAFHSSFDDLVATHTNAMRIAIDIPIGLGEGYPRRCDIEARRVLGQRRSSVFPAPDPRLLDCTNYADANSRSRVLLEKGMSAQAYGICAKVKQVNSRMTPELQKLVVEAHPEVSFWAMNDDEPMTFSKKRSAGFAERRELLQRTMKVEIPDRRQIRVWARPAHPDDVLDALAVAWTASRAAEGRAQRFPNEPEFDARGLRMEIVY
ncbi:MAG: DUF429 domain-containing protein [Thermomicrobiales bacterium]